MIPKAQPAFGAPDKANSRLQKGDQVEFSPEHKGLVSSPEYEEYMAATPVVVELVRPGSGNGTFARVVNARGQASEWNTLLLQQASTYVVGGALAPATLPAIGDAVQLMPFSSVRHEPKSVSFFQDGKAIVKGISGEVATLQNRSTGQTSHYSLSHLQKWARDAATQAGAAIVPGFVTLATGTVDLSAYPGLQTRSEDDALVAVLEKSSADPQVLKTLDGAIRDAMQVFPADVVLSHFTDLDLSDRKGTATAYRSAMQALQQMQVTDPGQRERVLEMVESLRNPEQRAELLALVGSTRDWTSARKLWEALQASPQPEAFGQVVRLLEGSSAPRLAAEVGAKALKHEAGLYVAERVPLEKAGLALDLLLQRNLSRSDSVWVPRAVGWDDPGQVLDRLLAHPESDRAEVADLMDQMRGRCRGECETALAETGQLLAEVTPERSLAEVRGRFDAFVALNRRGSARDFHEAGLGDPGQFKRWRNLLSDGYSASDAARCLQAAPGEASPGWEALLARRSDADTVLADAPMLSDDSPLPLEQRLDLLEQFPPVQGGERLRPEYRRLALRQLEQVYPEHGPLLRQLQQSPVTSESQWRLTVAVESRGAHETLAQCLARQECLMALDVERQPAMEAFRWISARPPEDQDHWIGVAQKRAATSREAGLKDLPLLDELRPPGLSPQENLARLEHVEEAFEPRDRDDAFAWLTARNPSNFQGLADRLAAHTKILGSLSGAQERLDKTITGVHEEAGAVVVGGVRVKRRS